MIPITVHFNDVAAQVRKVLPSLRDGDLAGSGIDLSAVRPANRLSWSDHRLNCYNYATADRRADYPGAIHDSLHPLQRREMPRIYDLMQAGPQMFFPFVECALEGMRKDGLVSLGFTPDFSRPGTLIAAFAAEGTERHEIKPTAAEWHDVHFLALRRLDETIEGVTQPQLVWAHKPGALPVEFCRAGAERAGDVSSPTAFFDAARADGYNYFAGFFLADPQTVNRPSRRKISREFD